MKHFKIIIALLLILLCVFSVSFSILAEPTSSELTESNTSLDNTSSDDTSSDNTSSEDTTSNNTSSDDTSSDNISSDNTSSDNASSDNTPSDNTSSDNTSSDNTSSDNTSSDNTSSDNTSSDNTSSDNTSSDNTSSDNTSSDNTPPPLSEEELDRLYGTKADGLIIPEDLTMWSMPVLPSLKNGGYTEGLRYWLSLNSKKASENATIVVDGENTYLSPNKTAPTTGTNGIMSLRFSYQNIVPGQAVVVIYDWAGSKDFTVKLEQCDNLNTHLVSSGFGTTLYTAKNDKEWNTNATKPIYPVRYTDSGYYSIRFLVKVEIHNPEADIKLDNLRIGFMNSNGLIYDVNGNEIKGEARTSSQAEPPAVEYIPPITENNSSNSTSTNSNDFVQEVIQRGGDNEELINTFIILGTIAICLILALVPSAIVKAAKKKK